MQTRRGHTASGSRPDCTNRWALWGERRGDRHVSEEEGKERKKRARANGGTERSEKHRLQATASPGVSDIRGHLISVSGVLLDGKVCAERLGVYLQ